MFKRRDIQDDEYKDIEKFLIDKSNEIKVRRKVNDSRKTGKIIQIFDDAGKLIYNLDSIFLKFCKEHNLPTAAFRRSTKNNGEPIFQNQTKANIIQLKNLGYYKYKGWYAKEIKRNSS